MAKDKTAPDAAVETQAPADAGIIVGETSFAVDVRPIEPRGKLIGFASVTINAMGGNVTIPDFKIFNGDKGLFVSNPSTKDASTNSGFRDTARVTGNDMKNFLNVAVRDAWENKAKEMQSRAAAVMGVELKPARIADQLAKAGEQAARDNATRQPPQRGERAAANIEH